MIKEKTIYTIGYSTFEINSFVKILKENNINSLIDVRSKPYSKYKPEYNKENLRLKLEKHNIIYRNYDKEFGAIQENEKYFTEGILDFNKYYKSEAFKNGYDKILLGILQGYRFAFMCAERDPSTCHRNIMVARYFYKNGFEINNIWDDGSIELQNSLEERLINQYFPNDNQINFFETKVKSKKEKIEESYILRNKEIGYKMNLEDEIYRVNENW